MSSARTNIGWPEKLELEAIYRWASNGLALFDKELRLLRMNPSFANMHGLDPADHIGVMIFDLLPHLQERLEPVMRQVMTQGEYTGGLEIERDGSRCRFHLYPIRDDSSAIVAIGAFVEMQKQTTFPPDCAKLFALVEDAPVGFALFDAQHRYIRVNEHMARINGYPISHHLGRNVRDVLPRNGAVLAPLIDQAFASKRAITNFELTGETSARPGMERQWLVSIFPIRAGDDVCWAGLMVVEITERKLRESHIHLLLRELTHRSKNMLAVIQAMARQTVAESTSAHDFEEKFSSRLLGLSYSHDLLLKENWQGASLADLVSSQLDRYSRLIGTRIEISGPDMKVRPEAAQSIGLALHELCANAASFGALSTSSGRVNVHWARFETEHGDQRLLVSWGESGGPPVQKPQRKGFGHLVLERMLPRALNGHITFDFAESGVQWTLEVPYADVIQLASV